MTNDSRTFAYAIAVCLSGKADPPEALIKLVRDDVLDGPENPDRTHLEQIQQKIDTTEYANNPIALIYGGATKIKGYVFEAPKLPEIRGASALLDWVNEVKLPALWGANTPEEFVEKGIIYASGGNILAFAPASTGQELATAIEHCYTDNTLTANSVAVCETFSLLELRYGRRPLDYWIDAFLRDWNTPDLNPLLADYYYGNPDEEPAQRFYRRKTFGELVTVLATKFNRRRDEFAYAGEPRHVPLYQMLPWAEKCDSSGIRPAVVRTRVGDELEPREMSEASARKRYVGQRIKKSDPLTNWHTKSFTWDIPESLEERSWEHKWEQYLDECTNSPYAQEFVRLVTSGNEIRSAQDLDEIAQASSPSRYIGVIYADGNNVGRLIATQKTPREYHDNSLVLSTAARNSVFKALATYLEPAYVRSEKGTSRWIHPFEILAIGGDDLFLIVPGDRAFDIALKIGLAFEEELAKALRQYVPDTALSSQSFKGRYSDNTIVTNDNYTPSIGLSAGVIIAQENAPIFFLRDLVEELLKSAKGLAKDNAKQNYYGGAVDFMVMKSVTMVTDNIKAFRKEALGDKSTRRLTARPYTWHEFAGLLATIRALKQAHTPRSQLYRLRQVLDADDEGGVVASVMEYLYTRSRMRGAPAEALLKYVEHYWCRGPNFPGGRKGLPPWLPLGKASGWETMWPDLLEAYEMVPEEEA